MAIVDIKNQLECSECKCEICKCGNCSKYFEKEKTIICSDICFEHFCSKECEKEHNSE